MRKLSVTEYLIQQNQAQETVTTYAHIGDAINHAMTFLKHHDMVPTIGSTYDRTPKATREGYEVNSSYFVEDFDTAAYVYAWRDIETGAISYTVEQVA